MPHRVKGCLGRPAILSVSGRRHDAPYFTEKSCFKLCLNVAANDYDHLGSITETCHKLETRRVKGRKEGCSESSN